MPHDNPYQSPDLVADEQSPLPDSGAADWTKWSPGQSRQLKEITLNMSSHERRQSMWRSGAYGLWCALSCGAPAGLLTIWFSPMEIPIAPGLVAAAFGLVIAHVAFLPIWLRWQRQFFCNTQWARSQSLRPEELRLFDFLWR